MSRPNSRWLIVPALVLAVVAVACGGGGEEKTLLNKYFMASKMNDNLTLANIATVSLIPPRPNSTSPPISASIR